MTAKDYMDTKGCWISPEDRTLRRMPMAKAACNQSRKTLLCRL
jgi:hypothetical protein